MLKRYAIYKCVFNNYDYLINERVALEEFDYFLFTNNKTLKVYPYRTIFVPATFSSGSLNNRKLKLIIPELLKNYDLSIYLDGNINVLKDLCYLTKKFLDSDADIGLFSNPYTTCVEDEIISCLKSKKTNEISINLELQYYKSKQMVADTFMTDNAVIFRKKHNLNMNNSMSEWFDIVSKFTGRDQISLPFITKKYNINKIILGDSPRHINNKYFVVLPHNPFSNISKFEVKKFLKFCFGYIVIKMRLGLFISFIKTKS